MTLFFSYLFFSNNLLINFCFELSEPPEEPRNLKVLEASSSTARLSWERPSGLQTMDDEDQLPIKSFTIEWTPLHGKQEEQFDTFYIKIKCGKNYQH